jgi:hypothetical protein
MATPEISIALTDDWELRGDGSGHVQDLQVRPATRLMDLYERLGVKSTFHVEVMQQLAFESYAGRYPEIARQRDLWIEGVRSMRLRGFDVQLHLHPHWSKAEYDGRAWKLGRLEHVVDYPRREIREMVSRAVDYLSRLVAPAKIVAFRSGSWGMGPPSREILETLIAHGIRIDVSMLPGAIMDTEAIRLDYTRLECPYKAYTPDLDDVRKIGRTKCGLVAVPTQTVPKTPALKLLSKCLNIPRRVAEKFRGGGTGEAFEAARLPGHAVGVPFRAQRGRGRWDGRGNWDYILDFSSPHSPRFLSILVDICIDRALKVQDRRFHVLVFANHTKHLHKDYDFDRIESAILHIQRKYADITFLTLSQVAERACELL